MIWVVLAVLGVICTTAVIIDGDFRRPLKRMRNDRTIWKDVLACTIQRVKEDERRSLHVRIVNTSDRTVMLPPISVWLGFSSAFGHPAKGGNGLDAIGLRDTITNGETLAPQQAIILPIDTAEHPARPAPFDHTAPKKQIRTTSERAEQDAKRRLSVRASQTKLAESVTVAGSVADFMDADGNEHFFLDIRPNGQYPPMGLLGRDAWVNET